MAVSDRGAMPRDREIVALALPALGALIAEPLYVLGDTAVVGHLGTVALAGLALGGLLLSEILGFCTFLEYGTTAKAARLYGAGEEVEALDVGVQATWVALGLGLVLLVAVELLAAPALSLLAGGQTPAYHEALTWLRIATLGAPFVLVTAAAQGWLRAFQDTRTPLIVIGAANVLSIALSVFLIRGLGFGIEGSAIANVTAQVLSGAAFGYLLVRRRTPLAPSWARMRRQLGAARDISLRTLGFFAAFTVATGVAARMGNAEVAAHQIGFQLWILTALVLDATAIAAQALIGRLLGAGADDAARRLAFRLTCAGLGLGLVFAAILALGHDVLPAAFTSDPEVRTQAAVLWPWFVAMLPLNGVLFALDGVFFGAGDLAFMRNVTLVGAVCGYLPITLLTAHYGLGLGGIWAGLSAFIWVRLAAGLWRWHSGRWLVTGTQMVDERALSAL
jgi:putative MATE family efflux protein